MLTLLVAPLTETSAVLGEPSLMEPRPAFWITPAPMETLPAVAPFMRATGMPPMRAQGPPHRPLETESRVPARSTEGDQGAPDARLRPAAGREQGPVEHAATAHVDERTRGDGEAARVEGHERRGRGETARPAEEDGVCSAGERAAALEVEQGRRRFKERGVHVEHL